MQLTENFPFCNLDERDMICNFTEGENRKSRSLKISVVSKNIIRPSPLKNTLVQSSLWFWGQCLTKYFQLIFAVFCFNSRKTMSIVKVW